MFKKRELVLVVSMIFILTSLTLINVSKAMPDSYLAENRPEEIPRPNPPFDFSKANDVSKAEEFAAKHNFSRAKQMGLPKGLEVNNEKSGMTDSFDTHYWWGAGISYWYGQPMGVYARHTVDEFLDLGSGNRLLYAPTLKGPAPCPLEVGTYYLAGSSEEPYLYVYDHYIGGFTDIELDVTELRSEHYLSAEGYYEVVLIWYENTWVAYLKDYATGWWDPIYTQPNDSYFYLDGFDMYEVHFDGTWPSDTALLKASEIMEYIYDIYYGEYYWDYNWGAGWGWGPGYELVNWPGGFNVPHGWNGNYMAWWAGVGRFYISGIDYELTSTYGGGLLYDPWKATGEFPDGNYAIFIDQYQSSSSRLVGIMNTLANGQISVYCYSQPGYVSDLYVYVSMDGYHWSQVGSKFGVGQTSPGWINIGYYSGNFRYIALCGYYTSRPVYLYVDMVRVIP